MLVQAALASLLSLALFAAVQDGPPQRRGPRGPETMTHDPVLIKTGDTYQLLNTGRGVHLRSSTDLKTWSNVTQVFDETPAWVTELIPDFDGNMWAPDVFQKDGTYYVYYSVSQFGRNNSAIGVVSGKSLDPESPDYGWTDHGMVVRSVPGRDMFNAIDPHIIEDDDGRYWMSFGSYWNGIKLVQLADNLTEVAEPQRWHTIAARHRAWKLDERDAGDAANPELDYGEKYSAQLQDAALTSQNGSIEAPTIYKKGDWYYLFVSWDRCCRGLDSTYKVVVGRSKTIEGPYFDEAGQNMNYGGGTLVTKGFNESERWVAGGHCDVVDMDGEDLLVLHAYDRSDRGRPKLVIKPLQWDAHGWPSVNMAEDKALEAEAEAEDAQ